MNENFRRLTGTLERWHKLAREDMTPQPEIDNSLDIDSITRLELVLALNKQVACTFVDAASLHHRRLVRRSSPGIYRHRRRGSVSSGWAEMRI